MTWQPAEQFALAEGLDHRQMLRAALIFACFDRALEGRTPATSVALPTTTPTPQRCPGSDGLLGIRASMGLGKTATRSAPARAVRQG